MTLGVLQLKAIGPLVATTATMWLLTGCSGGSAPDASADTPPPPPPLPAPSAAESALALGLTQTPSAEQVRQSFRIGRLDPFASANDAVPLAQAQSSATRLTPEQISASLRELQVQGIVQVSGRQAVFVTYQGQSGEVFPGQLGGADTPFLPQGWRLLRIHANRGQIELANQAVKAIIEL